MANKVNRRIVAVLNSDWHYAAHNGDNVVKKGVKFVCKDGHYIDKAGDLVLEHWIQYGDASVIPAAQIDLYLEEVEIVKNVKLLPAKVEGKYVVPVAPEAAE